MTANSMKGKTLLAVLAALTPLTVAVVAGGASRPARAEVAGGQPNLSPTWTRASASCRGSGRRIRCTIKGKLVVLNDGVDSSPTTTVDLWVSRDDILDPKVDKKVQTLEVPALAAGADTLLELNFRTPRGTKVVRRHLIAVVDPDDNVDELDETDNVEAIGPLR